MIAGLTADWSADVRRRLCRVAFGQDLPTLETTPVGELLDRIDGDVYQVASELRGSGVRIAQGLAVGTAVDRDRLRRVVAGRPRHAGCWPPSLWSPCAGPRSASRPARMVEEEAWSDLAAVMEESIHGQDDVRTSLARPYVLRLLRAAGQRGAAARPAWCGDLGARVTAIAVGVIRGPASRSPSSAACGRW